MHEQRPLRQAEQEAGATFMAYGPPVEERTIEIAQDYGAYEAEYAAIRQRVGVMHLPQRGILRLTGSEADRRQFLHRMLTQDLSSMTGGATRRAFQLNEKGRIVADVLVHHGQADTWLELDRVDLPLLRELLEARLFTEDVSLEDFADQRVALALHGPAAQALLEQLADEGGDAVAAAVDAPGTHHVLRLAGVPVTVYRRDDAGSLGLHLWVLAQEAERVYQRLLEAAGFDPRQEAELSEGYAKQRRQGLRGRPVGWLAYNTARIEAGTPIFHIDFGRDSLPAETGVLEEAVSFTKGCYVGQEIVARMKHLGHPRRVLVGLRFEGEELPVAGAQVFAVDADGQALADQVVGGITSSTISPMLGQRAIAFAVVQWGRHQPGTTLAASAQGGISLGQVQALRFLS
ncbi:MAG TPA: glycine cleavage T C-terminal barrel domain-containing protein [Phycisphaeraceae bacterium]